jgi:hypothetical protein
MSDNTNQAFTVVENKSTPESADLGTSPEQNEKRSCDVANKRCSTLAKKVLSLTITVLVGIAIALVMVDRGRAGQGSEVQLQAKKPKANNFDNQIGANANRMIDEGRNTFRFDTFGDEAFWGDTLKLHQAIEGSKLGGVGNGVSPQTALDLGLKVDVDALPKSVEKDLEKGTLDLSDPANTVALLKANAVLGVKGIFQGNTLTSVGLTCAVCHSTVDNSLAFGVGHRLDGWANHDLNVGAIVASAPNLQPVADFLGVTVATLKTVLNSWGPGKFDAEIFLDGKAFNPQQVSNGVVTGTNVPGATLIPNAFGLAGFNQHTWTGAWGTVTYWNAFVANLELHGKGRFFDPRLNNAAQFPIAAANHLGDLPHIDPDDDLITKKLPALHFYQLAIPAPTPQPGQDFDPAAAKRGDDLFSGKAKCNNCHVDPLWTEPGWNLHTPAEIGLDSFQADRAPDHTYKTSNLAGIFVRENGLFMRPANRGRYFHDGRFKTLLDVMNHYNVLFNLGLTDQEKRDVVEYLKSLPES